LISSRASEEQFGQFLEEGTYAKLSLCDPRKSKPDENKTDKIDARRLAELPRLNALKPVCHGQDSTRAL